eukprot:8278181-Prorocentrum_lima.AAC.1
MPLGVAMHVILDHARRPLAHDAPEPPRSLRAKNRAAEPTVHACCSASVEVEVQCQSDVFRGPLHTK